MASPAVKPTLEPVVHGGDLGEISRRFPDAPQPWIDLSTGINPIAYPVPTLPASAWATLPTAAAAQALLVVAAQRYGVRDPANIVAAPGTQALIQILPGLLAKSRVAVLGPTYLEHEACWRRHGHDVSAVEHLEQASGSDVLIVVNPNNPTGRLLAASALRDHAGLLVVDEAFMDLLPHTASLAPDLPPRTVVLRSFGKTYGLAGVRLGFAIAEAPLIERMRAALGPWAVSGPALEVGRLALSDERWLADTRRRLGELGTRLDTLLGGVDLEVIGGTPLFRLTRHRAARSIAERLGCGGIHVRRFAGHPDWLRFGLPADDAAFDRLEAALKSG